MAADVLAEREGERRGRCRRRPSDLMISPSVTISRFSFGISRPMTDLPGMTSTTRTLMRRQRRAPDPSRGCEIWLTLTPGAGRISKRVITGPGMHRDHFDFDAEILELDLDQARHAPRALRPSSRARAFGGSSSSDSGGSSFDFGGSNIVHLAFLLDALALLDHRRRRLDARCGARRRLLLLDAASLARLPCARALRRFRARYCELRADQRERVPGPVTDASP